MQSLHLLQDVIHKLEVGLGRRFVRYLVFALGVSALLIVYDFHCYRNMASPTAMDAAQLAHNIARGRGYTTQFIRPLSIYLVKQKNRNAADNDPARLNSGHPDLANPPVYPVVLAGLMKVLPFQYDTGLKGAFWRQKSTFWSEPDPGAPGGRRGTRYQPDFLIALFNQFLFLVLLALVFSGRGDCSILRWRGCRSSCCSARKFCGGSVFPGFRPCSCWSSSWRSSGA